MVQVIVKNNEFHKALAVFQKKVKDDGILQTYRERRYYEKPSDQRRRLKKMAKLRWNKEQRKRLKEFGF